MTKASYKAQNMTRDRFEITLFSHVLFRLAQN